MSIICNSKNGWLSNTCYLDSHRRKNKVHPTISYLGSENQNKLLACKLLLIRLLESGKCLKAPKEGILYEYYEYCSLEIIKKNTFFHQVISFLFWKQKESEYLKCHFDFFDKLKYKSRNKVLIFISILKLGHKTLKWNGFLNFKTTGHWNSTVSLFFVFHFNLKNKRPDPFKQILAKLDTIFLYVITINRYKMIK